MGPAEKQAADLNDSVTSIETKMKATTDATALAGLKAQLDGVKAEQKAVNDTMKEPKSFLSKAKASSGQGDVFRGLFFLLCFFTIGLVSNFKKLMEEGLGKLALVYCISLLALLSGWACSSHGSFSMASSRQLSKERSTWNRRKNSPNWLKK